MTSAATRATIAATKHTTVDLRKAGRYSRPAFVHNEGMQAHWSESTVGEHGELLIEGVPFQPGQAVDVLVVPRVAPTVRPGEALHGTVLKYDDPFEPVANEDWEALR
jgi:hypothetical protein